MWLTKMQMAALALVLVVAADQTAPAGGSASAEKPKVDRDKPKDAEPQKAKSADKSELKFPTFVVKYKIVAEAMQPAGSPILLKLLWTNTGKEPLGYWVPLSDANYPPVHLMAKVTDARGKVRELSLSNGLSECGSGDSWSLGTGESMKIPAAIAPLPEGVYLIEVGGDSVKITVKDDAELRKKREDNLLAGIGKGEPFARYVAAAYLTPALRERLLQELSATDFETAWQAVGTLYRVEKLSADAVPLLAQAMEKHLALEKELGLEKSRSWNRNSFWNYLTEMTGRIGTDEALEAVLKLAHSDTGIDAHLAAATGVQALGMFKQERAVKELHNFLNDPDLDTRYTAALTLADHRDPAAVEVLLAITANSKCGWRGDACQALAKYPDDPRAEPAIMNLLDDRFASDQAKYALEQLHKAQKK
jgi:hypothetical protein